MSAGLKTRRTFQVEAGLQTRLTWRKHHASYERGRSRGADRHRHVWHGHSTNSSEGGASDADATAGPGHVAQHRGATMSHTRGRNVPVLARIDTRHRDSRWPAVRQRDRYDADETGHSHTR